MSRIKVDKPRVDKSIIQSFYCKIKKQNSSKDFNLITLSNKDIWDIIRFRLEHIIKARYINHKINEEFIKEFSFQDMEMGSVNYYLTIEYILEYEKL